MTRPTRSQALRRRWLVVGGAVVVVAVAVVLLFTPVFGVRSVAVTGTHALTKDEVRAAARVAGGTPMVWVDTDAIGTRVAKLPQVASVTVSRSLPSSVEIEVDERSPVAVFSSAEGTRLVDGTGMPYRTVEKTPKNLPRIDLPKVAGGDPATMAVVGVLGAIPEDLRARMTSITSSPQGDVRFTLSDGKEVKWGTAAESDRKAAVLKVLLSRQGTVYNVSSPDLPGVS